MKKVKTTLKKSSNIKSTSKSTAVVSRVKTLAKGLVKAMSAKAPQKSLMKQSPKNSKPGSKTAPVKPAAKANVSHSKTAPVKDMKHVKSAPVKPAPVDAKAAKGKPVPAPATPVAAVLTKPAPKAKAATSRAPRLSAAQIAENLEKMCRENTCENPATTKGYCRVDYIKNWKKIKRKEMILKEGKLNQYIEELVSKYPDKYIDVIRQDLSTEVNFTKVIHDLELDESIDDLDYDGDSIDSLIGSISKDREGFDDEEFLKIRSV